MNPSINPFHPYVESEKLYPIETPRLNLVLYNQLIKANLKCFGTSNSSFPFTSACRTTAGSNSKHVPYQKSEKMTTKMTKVKYLEFK